MTLIGQPETYSDVLSRVFTTTLVTGVACSVALAHSSADFKTLFDSVPFDADIGPVKGLKVLYVLLPGGVAVLSRVVKLHDRISDLLGLRRKIDLDYVLVPLAQGVGVDVDVQKRFALQMNRRAAMYKVFYPYVSLPEAKIDRQLVRTALDNLGWFWVGVEALALLLPTTVGVWALGGRTLIWLAVATIGIAVLTWIQWHVCKRGTAAEVDAILSEQTRQTEIRAYFSAL